MAPLPISHQIAFFFTYDLEKTARFYTKTMQLQLVLKQKDCCIWRVTQTSFIGFCERENVPLAPPDNSIFSLVTDDVDGWFKRLSKKGVKFEQTPVLNPDYQVYQCLFRDPNGFLIEIQRFEHPFP